jgi:formamidopyrimidine-DNA glycosylase
VPELPEVETIRRHLAPHVDGRTLQRLEIHDARWTLPLAPPEVATAVAGRRVEKLGRRGKYLVWELEDDVYLLLHLRMTGTLLLDPPERPPHTRVTFDLGEHTLEFVDPRRFGTGELALGPEALDDFFAKRLGVEPFEPEFTGEYLYELTRHSRAPIKAMLLDQKRIAGVGNIYADEALFRARIHPWRLANRINRKQAAALRDAIVETLELGIESKGATIDDFRDPEGVSGSFQDRFLIHLREGEPCVRCGRPVRKLRAAGRGTYVCESCQPRPRTRPPRPAPRADRRGRP